MDAPNKVLMLAAVAALLCPGCFNPEDASPDDDMADDMADQGPAPSGAADDPAEEAASPCTMELYNFIEYGDLRPDLDHVYVSPSSASSWGSDILESPIVFGAGLRITDVPGGLWDVRVVDEDGTGYETYLAFCDGGTLRWDILAAHASN